MTRRLVGCELMVRSDDAQMKECDFVEFLMDRANMFLVFFDHVAMDRATSRVQNRDLRCLGTLWCEVPMSHVRKRTSDRAISFVECHP